VTGFGKKVPDCKSNGKGLIDIEDIPLQKPRLGRNHPFGGDYFPTKVNLELLMMEHNRGLPIWYLNAHDTFGSFIAAVCCTGLKG
jgi:hypothetical protein